MFIFDYIDPVFFLIAFVVGLVYTFVSAPAAHVVVRYPTPENAGKVTYKDDADVCYRYKVIPTTCPIDVSQLRKVPLQMS
jgi:hypothetical protein